MQQEGVDPQDTWWATWAAATQQPGVSNTTLFVGWEALPCQPCLRESHTCTPPLLSTQALQQGDKDRRHWLDSTAEAYGNPPCPPP
jgi:hypothetical protein